MTIRWTPTGIQDLESLHSYIAGENTGAAGDVVEKIISAIDALTRHPELGRTGRISGTRELIVDPYVIAYRVRKDAIEVLAIIHGARRWPDSF